MPIYEYRCDNGHVFEVMQRITDDPVSTCNTCDAPVKRVFHPVAVHFKGSGFHNTDYGTRKRKRELESAAESGADSHADKAKSGSGSKDSTGSTESTGNSAKPEKTGGGTAGKSD